MQRINKLKGKRDEYKKSAETEATRAAAAERERDELKSRLEKAGTIPQVAPSPADPLADVDSMQGLEEARREAKAIRDQCDLHPEGFEHVIGKDAKGEPITREIEANEIPKIKVWANKMLEDVIPTRGKYLTDRAKFDAQAKEIYPEIFNKETPEHQEAMLIISQIPELLRVPNALLALGQLMAGRKAEQARNGNGNGNGKAPAETRLEPFTRQHPPIAPPTTKARGETARPVTTTDDSKTKAARERLLDDDSEDAAEDLIGAILAGARRTGGREPTLS